MHGIKRGANFRDPLGRPDSSPLGPIPHHLALDKPGAEMSDIRFDILAGIYCNNNNNINHNSNINLEPWTRDVQFFIGTSALFFGGLTGSSPWNEKPRLLRSYFVSGYAFCRVGTFGWHARMLIDKLGYQSKPLIRFSNTETRANPSITHQSRNEIVSPRRNIRPRECSAASERFPLLSAKMKVTRQLLWRQRLLIRDHNKNVKRKSFVFSGHRR